MKKDVPIHVYLSFSAAIFLGAFLLFQVQPIIGKYILPWFGGVSSVWITAMLFFQVLLLLGYLYVFLLSYFSLKKQIILHIFVLLIATLSVFFLLADSKIPVFPDISIKLNDNYSPVINVLQILFTGVGFTYFILSTTSILLQKWFGLAYRDKSPYFFYALSNTGSLLALVSYPFIVEPFMQLKMQGIIWSIGFLVYSIFLSVCSAQMLKSRHVPKQSNETFANIGKMGRKKLFLWILLPAISSLMLMSTTNLLTLSVASVPFLWLVPLSIYLVSFIICFSDKKLYSRSFFTYISLIAGFLSLVFMFSNIPSVSWGIVIYGLTLLSACMLCHGELYHLRPALKHLDLYYLCIALGSALSGIFVGIIAPLYFKGIWETYIGFYFVFLLTIWIVIYYNDPILYKRIRLFMVSDKEAYVFSFVSFPVIIISTQIAMTIMSGSNPLTVKVWRNFYGILSVKHSTAYKDISQTVLKNGNIIHGTQLSGKLQNEPTSYYGKKSGIGLAILNNPRYGKRLNMGIIGLGSGTLAAYGKKGDKITFYEINPQVVKIANDEFTYLKNSNAETNVVLGDGRLSLQNEIRENKEKYDILVLDAFSDDSIPLHLLTREAFDVYLKRLKNPSGTIAFHISNRYVDLKPVLIKAADYYRLNYGFIYSHDNDLLNQSSEWALLSYDKKLLEVPVIASKINNKNRKEISLWTDDYSNLFQALK